MYQEEQGILVEEGRPSFLVVGPFPESFLPAVEALPAIHPFPSSAQPNPPLEVHLVVGYPPLILLDHPCPKSVVLARQAARLRVRMQLRRCPRMVRLGRCRSRDARRGRLGGVLRRRGKRW